MDSPIFVFPEKSYPSYLDFLKLADVSGFQRCHESQINLDDGAATYIFVTPEGIPNCTQARARTIFWQLEYNGDYCQQSNRETVSELWASDLYYAELHQCKYVLLGSDARLVPNYATGYEVNVERGVRTYDLVMLAYMTPRRQAIRHQLAAFRWPVDYPGHDTYERHEILSTPRLMLHVHQHEDSPAFLPPLRLALAAAYRLPVISEDVLCRGVYDEMLAGWGRYGDLADLVVGYLAATKQSDGIRHRLYELLCEQHCFAKCVMEALASK
jgi:hypothetical protein